jgi:hypothetical protein
MAEALRRFAGLPQETEQETGQGEAGVRPVGNVPPHEINAAAE